MHRELHIETGSFALGAPAGQLEAVLLGDERVRVHDSTRFPWRAVCHLESRFPTGVTLAGTCALVHSALALTAAHCVFDRRFGGLARQVFVSPGRYGEELPFGRHLAHPIWVPQAWQRAHRASADIAVIELEHPVGKTTGWFGLGLLTARQFRSQLLNLCGYPVDMPPAPIPERGKWQYWSVTRVVSVQRRLVRHLADTYFGQSGSPIWMYGSKGRWIVAVHTTGSQRSNAATQVTSSVLEQVRACAPG